MYQVKIIGAGSIGNHLAHASRRLGWKVTLCDLDDAVLARTRTQIYPQRYGDWDDEIVLRNVKDAPRDGFDLVAIGTPPDSDVALALDALAGSPRALLVEKPLCSPDLECAEELRSAPAGMRILDRTNELPDFAETAGLIMNLDLIIAIDTATVHLAGALGKEVWTLLDYASDWRWLWGREDSPWYPTMRLFRQPRPGDWESVFLAVERALNSRD